MRFLDFLFPPRSDERILRGVSNDDFLAQVAPRLAAETRPETVTLLSFGAAPVRAALHEAKYRGNEYAFGLLGAALAEYLRDADSAFGKPVVVPVPLGKERRRERGFNQVEEIARRALLGLDGHFILDATLLERVKETQTQVSLERRKREENMRGAFRVAEGAARPINPAYTYIVLDDVLTTGATLQAAVDALRAAGAEHITPLALAH
jgi:ComF family protein